MRRALVVLFTGALLGVLQSACGEALGGGSDWVKQPLPGDTRGGGTGGGAMLTAPDPPNPKHARVQSRTLGGGHGGAGPGLDGRDLTGGGGRVLGTFRNTYYDFPQESDHKGGNVSLMTASCKQIASVPKGFYDAICVQGSGRLAQGATVSFAKRDCPCAETCARTGQKICFEQLDPSAFPWGRGASGKPIQPMRSVAADTSVLPMGTVLYIPELDLDGVADGCFVVEDRGSKVKGDHVDIFTGKPAETVAMNERVPSNQGVTIVVDAPRCAHLAR